MLMKKTQNIKTILCDVDGCQTNGKKIYNKYGECIAKEFYDEDFTAFKHFKQIPIPIYMISADSFNLGIAQKRNIDFIQCDTTGINSKYNICKNRFNLSNCLFVGNSYYDLELLWHVGYPFCPNDAIDEVKKCCTILPKNGGEGVILSLYEYCVKHFGFPKTFPMEY